MALKGFEKNLLNLGREVLVAYAPYLARQLVQRYNRMVLNGEIDRARAAIKQEFVRNRVLAKKIYDRHQRDMEPDVAGIYQAFMKEG